MYTQAIYNSTYCIYILHTSNTCFACIYLYYTCIAEETVRWHNNTVTVIRAIQSRIMQCANVFILNMWFYIIYILYKFETYLYAYILYYYKNT